MVLNTTANITPSYTKTKQNAPCAGQGTGGKPSKILNEYKDMESGDHLRTYFLSMGRALNRNGLNAILELGTRCIHDWLAGKIDLPRNARPKVEAWARRYGYQEHIQYDTFL
jgi:hypothetical protein